MYSRHLARLLNAWPGKKRFGMYRFLPGFFVLGAMLELTMINLQVGDTNFYTVYKRNQARKIIEEEKIMEYNIKPA